MIYKRYFFEIWQDIYEYEGLYQISNYGRVRSVERMTYNGKGEYLLKERMLKLIENKGYLIVMLYKEGKGKLHKVHRLVAQHFVQKKSLFDDQVNHKDENKHNNCWLNLEWCSVTYNNNYGTRTERMAKTLTNGKKSKPVLQIDKTTREVIKEFPSLAQVQRELGFSYSNIGKCCLGRLRQAYGYYWKIKDAS